MAKLNQIIAVEKPKKAKAQREFTELHRETSKTPLLSGISRTYTPRDDEGDKLPSEKTLVQVKAEEVINKVSDALTDIFDITLTKEKANAVAIADVKVGGEVLLKDVPVTYLLFLEKQLTDIHTFVKALPVLDSSEEWTLDPSTGAYVTDVSETVRTKKVPKTFVKYEATKEHPAQVDVFHEDVIVGTWATRKFSGALPAPRVNELVSRVEALQTAVKFAREEANNTEVTDAKAGEKVFSYIFKK